MVSTTVSSMRLKPAWRRASATPGERSDGRVGLVDGVEANPGPGSQRHGLHEHGCPVRRRFLVALHHAIAELAQAHRDPRGRGQHRSLLEIVEAIGQQTLAAAIRDEFALEVEIQPLGQGLQALAVGVRRLQQVTGVARDGRALRASMPGGQFARAHGLVQAQAIAAVFQLPAAGGRRARAQCVAQGLVRGAAVGAIAGGR